MDDQARVDVLRQLDEWRRASGVADDRTGVVREMSADGTECRIVYAPNPDVIPQEQERARAYGYTLEWKTYGHDRPADLGARLEAAGFEPDDEEQVLILPVRSAVAAGLTRSTVEVRRVLDAADLAHYTEIAREIGRRDPEGESARLAEVLPTDPGGMSIHIAFDGGEPVSCGRVYFPAGSPFAELAGARTKTTHRRRGFFTAVVAARVREAEERRRELMITDALPTSELILRHRGFQAVTSTRPYLYEPVL